MGQKEDNLFNTCFIFFFVAGCKMEVDLDIIYIETRKK